MTAERRRAFVASPLRWIACAAMCVACSGPVSKITDTIDKVNATLSDAIKALEDQSASWQDTLKSAQNNLTQDLGNLETKAARDLNDQQKQIVDDVHGLIEQVQGVVKDGVEFTQESLNCQTDIFASHARTAVMNMLNAFLNKYKYKGDANRPMIPYVPIVCSTNPTGINVGKWSADTFLVLSGTDLSIFDTKAPEIVLVGPSGNEWQAPFGGNRETNYRFAVNVQPLIAQGLMKDAVQLQVRWSGQRVNRNEIPIVPCGGIGRPCCRGTCDQGACVNDVCQSCGAPSQHCCPGGACSTGTTCVSTVCSACGGIDQPCCHGAQCSVGTCLNQQCTACGDLGQSCCYGRQCNGGAVCESGRCAAKREACMWTADFSEEGVAEQHCPSGSAMSGARCTGSYCDNVALWCCPYLAGPDASASKSWSGSFSEENGGRLYTPAQASQFVAGLRCRGDNCDNLQMEYIRTPHLAFGGACYESPLFSEEGHNYFTCLAGRWVGGMACRGDYCDSMSVYCCQGTPVH